MDEDGSGLLHRLLFDLVNAVGNSLDLQETLGELDVRLRRLIAYQAFVVWLPVEKHLAPGYVSGDESSFLCAQEIPIGGDIAAQVAAAKPESLPLVLSFPLRDHSGPVAVLAMYRREGEFGAEDRQVLEIARVKIAAAVANSRRHERLQRVASVDPESSLPNERALFLRLDAELARARRNGSPVGVVLCGIGAGPVHWSAVAEGLRQICREDDCVARMGNDVILVLAGLSRCHLPKTGNRIEALFASHGLVPAMGAAFYPEDGAYADDLLAIAEERRRHEGP